MEDVPPPLPLDLPLLLVKPPVGLSTPEIFKALDLSKRSAADPREVRGAARRWRRWRVQPRRPATASKP